MLRKASQFLSILLAIGVFMTFSAASASAEDGIVVWRLETKSGVQAQDVDLISGYLTSEVARVSGQNVISEADIQTVLKGEETRQQCGVDDTSCIAEIGAALGVPEAVSGELGKLGAIWILNLRRINIRDVKVVGRASRQVEGPIEALVQALPGAVAELLGTEPGATPAKPVPKGVLKISTTPDGAQILIDGESVGSAPLSKTIPVGSYRVQARMDGYSTVGQRVHVTSGEPTELKLDLVVDYPMNPYKLWGHVTFWTGLGLAGVGAAMIPLVMESADEVRNGKSGAKDLNTAFSATAVAGLTVGGALMATGVVLWILSPGDEVWAKQQGLAAAPTADGQGAVAVWTGRF